MIIIILILAGVLRLISLNQSFWLDEAVQAVISSKSLMKINFGADFQPPLFYALSHFWLSIGIKSEWFLRLPSVFFGVLTVYLSFYFFKKILNREVGLLSALFLATAPLSIYYSQEFRMYSLLTLLVLLSWIFLWQKRWIFYGLTILLSVFTHYFAFFAILSQFIYIYLYERKNASRYILHLSLFLSPFLLWLPTVGNQLQTAQKLTSLWPKWKEILGTAFFKFPPLVLAKFTVGVTSPEKLIYIPTVLILGTIFIFALIKVKEKLLLAYFFIPLILSWILGLWISGNSPHRLLFVLPAFYGIIAAGLYKIKNQNLKIILISVILISNISFSAFYLLNPQNHRENWREAVEFTDQKIGERGIVLSQFNGPFAPMVWYSKKANKYEGSTNLSNIKSYDPVILYTYLFEIFDPQKKVEENILKYGFELKSEKDFRGVGIIKIFNAEK